MLFIVDIQTYFQYAHNVIVGSKLRNKYDINVNMMDLIKYIMLKWPISYGDNTNCRGKPKIQKYLLKKVRANL